MHMAMWIMSDRTIPRSLRLVEGLGVHTFRLVNPKGKASFVKFHWKPKLGLQAVSCVERGGKAERSGSRLPPPRFVECDQKRRFPGMGTRAAVAEAGPREAPERGFRSYPEAVAGDKLRVRGELFADHYSQAPVLRQSNASRADPH
jgi:catalase